MEIHIDLFGCKESEDVLLRFGEILQFGGPKGNSHVKSILGNTGWGLNWNAFNDSLRYLEVGGIWGSSTKIEFPLKLIIHNYLTFSKNEPKKFGILKEILEDHQKEYSKRKITFEAIFN